MIFPYNLVKINVNIAMNETNKKYIIAAIVLVLVIGGAVAIKKSKGGNTPKKPKGGDTSVVSPTPTPNLDTKNKSELYQYYLDEGQKYRTAGFQGDTSAFYKAIDVYKKAAEVSDNKVWVPYLNLGTTYQAVKDFKSAEEAYNKAIEIGPGEGMLFLK